MYYFIRSQLARLVIGKEKAIAAFLVAALATLATKHGLNLDATKTVYLEAAVAGIIAHLAVYIIPNRKG